MKNTGLSVSDFTYNPLIDGYGKKGNMVEALRLRDEMAEKGILPTVSTYNTLIHGLCKMGKVREGKHGRGS